MSGLCASLAGWCLKSYHTREPILVEMFWAAHDLLNNLNHGMTFCPRLASWLFLIAVYNFCFPLVLRNFSRRTPLLIVKAFTLVLFPFFGFQMFWRPYNFFLHFLVTNVINSAPCTEWLPIMSLASSVVAVCLSAWSTGFFTRNNQTTISRPRIGTRNSRRLRLLRANRQMIAMPVVERANRPRPVIERSNRPTPVIERANQPRPVIERANRQTPVIERTNRQRPVIERANRQTPVIERANQQTLVIERANQQTSVIQRANKPTPVTPINQSANQAIPPTPVIQTPSPAQPEPTFKVPALPSRLKTQVSQERSRPQGLKAPSQPRSKTAAPRKPVETKKSSAGFFSYFFGFGGKTNPDYKRTRSGCIYGRWS